MDGGCIPALLLLYVQAAGRSTAWRQQPISDLLRDRTGTESLTRHNHRPTAVILHSLGTFYCHDNQLASHTCAAEIGGFRLRPTASCSTQIRPCIRANTDCWFCPNS